MREMRNIIIIIWQFPLVAAGFVVGSDHDRDVKRHLQPRLDLPLPADLTISDRANAMRHEPLRTILYYRLRSRGGAAKFLSTVLSRIYKPEIAFTLRVATIGPGLIALHGFATRVGAMSMGADCQVSQQVTVGHDDRGGCPTIGDRVRIGANAVVLGPITIGDDAVIGAGAVVVKDVAPGTVVGGVPARVLNAADRFSAVGRTV